MAWPFDDKPINPLVGTRVGNAMANPPDRERALRRLTGIHGIQRLGRASGCTTAGT